MPERRAKQKPRVLAFGAHPDDVEFMMAGTLILLAQAGYEPHIMTVANGSCGTMRHEEKEIIQLRRQEAENAARLINAQYHPGLVNDLEVYYESWLIKKVAAKIREIRQEIILAPSPNDYMEDHQNTARIVSSAAFYRAMRNYRTDPSVQPMNGDVFVFHALPYGLRDGMRRGIWAESYVDISDAIELKERMLACHKTQKEWLDESQGLNAYLEAMRMMSQEVAGMSGQKWRYAEGWRRHNHLGLSGKDNDRLAEVLGNKVWVDPAYQQWLDRPPWEMPKKR